MIVCVVVVVPHMVIVALAVELDTLYKTVSLCSGRLLFDTYSGS